MIKVTDSVNFRNSQVTYVLQSIYIIYFSQPFNYIVVKEVHMNQCVFLFNFILCSKNSFYANKIMHPICSKCVLKLKNIIENLYQKNNRYVANRPLVMYLCSYVGNNK